MTNRSDSPGADEQASASSTATGSALRQWHMLEKPGIAVLLLVLAFLLVKTLTPDGLATSPDSIAYLEIAESLRNGHGIARPNRSLATFGTPDYTAETLWPPLYPALLAMVTTAAFDVGGVQWLSVTSLGLMLFFIFLVLRRMTSAKLALLLTCMSSVTLPVLLDYSYIWSETVFLALYAAILWAVVNFLEYDLRGHWQRRGFLLVLPVLIVALFYTRYIGVVALLVPGYLYYRSSNRRSDLRYFIVCAALCTIPVVYLLAHNALVAGSITGDARPPSTLSAADLVRHVLMTLEILLPAEALVWALCSIAALAIVALVEWRARAATVRDEVAARAGYTVVSVARFLTLLYVTGVLVLRYVTRFDEIDLRLLSPVLPTLWVLLCALVLVNGPHRGPRAALRVAALLVIVAMSVQGWRVYTVVRSDVMAGRSVTYAGRSDFEYVNYTHVRAFGELPSLLTWNILPPVVMASSAPSRMQFITQVPAVALPQKYDLAFLDGLSRIARPRPAGIFLGNRSELQYFQNLIEGSGYKYQRHNVAEGVLIVF